MGKSEVGVVQEQSNLDPGDTLEAPGGLDLGRGRLKVLVVDDEVHILKAVRRLFLGQDYDVTTVDNGEEARRILGEEEIAVIVSDQRMPGMTGAELLRHAKKSSPNTVRIMLTGNNDVTTAVEAINEGAVFRFVAKPWDHDEFLHLIELAIEHHELLSSKERYENYIQSQNEKLRQLNDELEDRVRERTQEVVAKGEEVSRLYSELQDSFDATIKALLCIMELGEIHVVEHCQRTAERVRLFSEFLKVDGELARELERAALLHWIGLINSSASLFRKDISELDAVEQATWEFHPLLGQQAIQHVPELREAGRFILQYLRRYDDPYFQPGEPSDERDEVLQEDFIMGCRILSICSAFERVRTRFDRTVKSDWSQVTKNGLKLLDEGSGSQFDPELVSRFHEMMSRELSTSRSREIVMPFDELEPGMVLARPLETAQGIPVAPRDMIITAELIERLGRFRDSNGLNAIHVWS